MNIEQADKQSDHIPKKAKKAVILDEKNLLSLRNDLTPQILNRLCKDFNLDMHFLLAQMFYLQKVINRTVESSDANEQDEEFQSFIESYFNDDVHLFEFMLSGKCEKEKTLPYIENSARQFRQDPKITNDLERLKRNLQIKFKTPANKTTQSLKESLTKIIHAVKSNDIQLTEVDLGCLDRLHEMAMNDLENDSGWFPKFIEGFPGVVNGDMSLQDVLTIARTRFHLFDKVFQRDLVKSYRNQLYNEAQFFISIQMFFKRIVESIDDYADEYGALYEKLCKETVKSSKIVSLQKSQREEYGKTGTLDN